MFCSIKHSILFITKDTIYLVVHIIQIISKRHFYFYGIWNNQIFWFSVISHIHQNETGTKPKKIECLQTYQDFHIYAKTESKLNAELKTCTKEGFIFSVMAAKFCKYDGFVTSITQHYFNYTCTYTTTCVVYNLVIMEAIDGLSSETIVQLFYKNKTTDFCLAKPRATIKATTKGSGMEHYQEVCRITRYVPNYTCTFLDFICGFGSYRKGLPKTKQCKLFSVCFNFISFSAYMWKGITWLTCHTIHSQRR